MINSRKYYFKGSFLANGGLTGAPFYSRYQKAMESFLKKTSDMYLRYQKIICRLVTTQKMYRSQ